MKDTCKQTSQHRRAPRVELICTRGDQPKSRIRIFQHCRPSLAARMFSYVSKDCRNVRMVSEHWPQTNAQSRLMFSCSRLCCFTYSLTCSLNIAATTGGIGSPTGAVGVGMVGRLSVLMARHMSPEC